MPPFPLLAGRHRYLQWIGELPPLIRDRVHLHLGHVFDGLAEIVSTLDAVFIESNYDPDMLEKGPYPAYLKARILGPEGHISNQEAAKLIREHASDRLCWVCLSHLSAKNNSPDLALQTHQGICASTRPLFAAGRDEPTGELKV